MPRFNHYLRCHHPSATLDAAERVDALVARTLIGILQLNSYGKDLVFSNTLFTLDLTRTISFADLAPLAFNASLEGLDPFANAPSQADRVEFFIQNTLGDDPAATFDSPLARVHSRALCEKQSKAWLRALPNRPEYSLSDRDWMAAVRCRYLVPPTNEAHPSCVCGLMCDQSTFVVHALTCNKVRGFTRASRHTLLKKAFKSVIRKYGYRPDEHEPRFGDNGEGPDIAFEFADSLLLVDVSAVCPLAASYVVAEDAQPGTLLIQAEREKIATYDDFAKVRGMVFEPAVFNHMGTPGPKTLALLRKLASTTVDPNGFLSHMLMACGVAISKGNGKMVSAAVARWWDYGVR
jgi:hypothetical protein